MGIRSFLIILIALSCSFKAQAKDYESLLDLQNAVLEKTQQYFVSRFTSDNFERDVQIEVGSLDSRLKLAKCPNPLTLQLKEGPNTTRHTTVKTSCEIDGARQWSIFVPVTINVFSQMVIATENLHKGDILTQANTRLSRANTSAISTGHIENINKALGKAIKRSIRSGEGIRMSYLDEAEVVKKGDPVTIEAKSSVLSVVTLATAMDNGYVGEMIKVRNNRSQRVVDAEVLSAGRVSVNR